MKKIFVSLICVFCFQASLKAEDPVDTKSEIEQVTVYLQGAQVTRLAEVELKAGTNLLRFPGLATGINPQSIQATAPPSVLINSVSHGINYLSPVNYSPRHKALKDSIQLMADLITNTSNKKLILQTERDMLLKNQQLAGKSKSVNISELEQLANFFRSRLGEIREKNFNLKKKQAEQTEIKNRLKQQLAELVGEKNQPSNDIYVTLKAEKTTRIQLALRYLVSGAGWVPSYDLRVKDIQSPIQLSYRAEVFQNSGMDWEDVKLTLSSANPNLNGEKPELSQWNLYLNSLVRGSKKTGYAYSSQKSKSGDYKTESIVAGKIGGGLADESSGMTLADFTNIKEGATSAEFVIDIRQNIPSSRKAHQVSIQDAELPATYLHTAIPKLDKDAFLMARITDWELLNLLPGKVNVFFEGTYITESYIDPRYTQDTLDFSLGRDRKVVIERNQMQDFNKVRSLGANRQRTFGYEFVIRNTKKEAIQLSLFDQIPISQDEKITVKIIEESGASINEENGEVSWKLNLAPAETKKVKLVFSVKHPKKETVPGI